MNYVPLVPDSEPLNGAVELLFTLEDYQPEHPRERLVPNGRTNLVFELDGRERFVYDTETGEAKQSCRNAWLSGLQSESIVIGETNHESRLAVVQFLPGGALSLVHRALSEFDDAVVPAEQVFGEEILELRMRLTGCVDPLARLQLLHAWLESRYDAELEPPEVIRTAMAELARDPGSVVWSEFHEQHGEYSQKHFIHLFKQHVGQTPKRYQRIVRFNRVFEKLQREPEGVSWAELSLELGYADQAHFIRDFHAFSGYRPRAFEREGHDRINFFPES